MGSIPYQAQLKPSRRVKTMAKSDLVEDLFKPRKEGDVPYIYAKKRLPMRHTYNLFEKDWDGLRKVQKNGKVTFEIDLNHNVVINGETGECRIPDTKNNRKRLERLCKPTKVMGTHREYQPDGTFKEIPKEIEVPPAYTRLDENLLERKTLDVMESKLLERISKKFDIVEKTQTDVPKGFEDEGKLLDPL